MSKKANMLLSDVFWFLLFVIVAVLMFLIMNNISSKVNNKLNPVDVQGIDAKYMATTLPRMGTRAGNNFSDVIRLVVADKHAGVTDLKQQPSYLAYKSFLDEAFGPNMFWQKPTSEVRNVTGYAIVLREGDTYITDTCLQYPANDPICNRLANKKYTDKETGMMVPYFFGGTTTSSAGVITIAEPVDIGTSYIPTIQGPVMLQVIIHYGVS